MFYSLIITYLIGYIFLMYRHGKVLVSHPYFKNKNKWIVYLIIIIIVMFYPFLFLLAFYDFTRFSKKIDKLVKGKK